MHRPADRAAARAQATRDKLLADGMQLHAPLRVRNAAVGKEGCRLRLGECQALRPATMQKIEIVHLGDELHQGLRQRRFTRGAPQAQYATQAGRSRAAPDTLPRRVRARH